MRDSRDFKEEYAAFLKKVPGGHVGFLVQAERYMDRMETFLKKSGI